MSHKGNIVELFQNPDGLVKIFGEDGVPSFQNVEVIRLDLRAGERTACLVIDLSEYPSEAPKKWKAWEANVCQVELTMFALEAVSIKGFCSPFKCDLKAVRQADGSLEVRAGDSERFVAIQSEFIRVNKVSAYRNGRLPAAGSIS